MSPHPTEAKAPPPLVTAQILACARAAHEANRAYCIANSDGTQFPWDAAPGWQRTSCINGVFEVLKGKGPEQLHESWMKEKTEQGWKHGPIKNADLKTHPCYLPYNELPAEQRSKDHIFLSVVTAVAKALGLAIETA